MSRGHALGQTGFVVDQASGKVREAAPDDEVSISLVGAGRWEEDPAFEEIPLPPLEGSRWRTLSCRRWLFEDDSLEPPTVGLAVIAEF